MWCLYYCTDNTFCHFFDPLDDLCSNRSPRFLLQLFPLSLAFRLVRHVNVDYHLSMYWFGCCLVTVLFSSVTIDSLYKVTEGRQSDIFHRHADGNFDPGCCFTIYHGNHMDSLDLVTSNAEEARTWVTGLRYLMAGISDEDSLAKRQRTHDQYPLYEPRWVGGWMKDLLQWLVQGGT